MAQELNLQPTCCGWSSANNCTLPSFSKAGEKSIQGRQVDTHSLPARTCQSAKGKLQGNTSLKLHFQLPLTSVNWFLYEKAKSFFSGLLHNDLSHLRMPAEKKKNREGPHSPVTGNVQCVSEKLARASLVSAFNVWHDGSVGLRGTHRLYMCAGKGSRYKLFSCMRTRPHRGRALTDPASFHPKQMCLCLLPSL